MRQPLMLFVSPHADDVCLSLGGFVYDTPSPKHLVTVFSVSGWAEPVWEGPRGADAITLARKREDRTFCAALGLTHHELDHADSAVRHGGRGNLRRPTGDERELESRVAEGLERLADEIGCDILVGPMGLGDHTDHVICCKSVRRAASRLGIGALYYEDLPYADELAPRRIRARARRIGWSLRPQVHRSRLALADKLGLIDMYESQRAEKIRESVLSHNARLADGNGQIAGHEVRAVERLWAPAGARTGRQG